MGSSSVWLAHADESTRAGRRPASSLPLVGSKSIQINHPFGTRAGLILQQSRDQHPARNRTISHTPRATVRDFFLLNRSSTVNRGTVRRMTTSPFLVLISTDSPRASPAVFRDFAGKRLARFLPLFSIVARDIAFPSPTDIRIISHYRMPQGPICLNEEEPPGRHFVLKPATVSAAKSAAAND